jgi:hypothetical protein
MLDFPRKLSESTAVEQVQVIENPRQGKSEGHY